MRRLIPVVSKGEEGSEGGGGGGVVGTVESKSAEHKENWVVQIWRNAVLRAPFTWLRKQYGSTHMASVEGGNLLKNLEIWKLKIQKKLIPEHHKSWSVNLDLKQKDGWIRAWNVSD